MVRILLLLIYTIHKTKWYIECAKGGANIIITAINENELQKVAKKCKIFGSKSIKYITMDLSLQSNCKLFVEKCLIIFKDKPIDYLFLNHVIGFYSEWINTKNINKFDINTKIIESNKMISTNLSAYISISTLLYKKLEKSGGKIIVCSSFAGYSIGPYISIYGACKHGISAFFENWRTELNMNKSNINITICIMSLVATKTAINGVKNVLSKSVINKAANPNKVAKRIISGAQNKLNYVYAPFMDMMFAFCLQKISPSLMTKITCYFNYRRFW